MNIYKKMIIMLVVMLPFPASCVPQQALPPTSTITIPPTVTYTASPVPSATNTPTSTREPTFTPVPLPGGIVDTFSNPSIISQDDFKFRGMAGVTPLGWINGTDSDQNRSIRVVEGNILKINHPELDFIYYYNSTKITPGTGVFLKFKFIGNRGIFTLGIDSVTDAGEMDKYRTEYYHSFALYVQNQKKLVHSIEGPYIKTLKSDGEIKWIEDTWYNLILAISPDNQYILQVWDPQIPEQKYTTTFTFDQDRNYYFIGWIETDRTLFMDDFTVFRFDDLKKVE